MRRPRLGIIVGRLAELLAPADPDPGARCQGIDQGQPCERAAEHVVTYDTGRPDVGPTTMLLCGPCSTVWADRPVVTSIDPIPDTPEEEQP